MSRAYGSDPAEESLVEKFKWCYLKSAEYVVMQCQNANLLVFGKGSSRLIA